MRYAKNAVHWPLLDKRKTKAARILAGFPIAANLAKRLGVARTTYAHWELGYHGIPPNSLAKLARLLKSAPEELVE